MCSNPEKNPDLGALSVTPVDFTWLHLCQSEADLLGTYETFDQIDQRLFSSGFGEVRFFARDLAVGRCLRLTKLEALPEAAQELARAFLDLQDAHAAGIRMGQLSTTSDRQIRILPFGYDVFVQAC
jgi:hypothetical protein